jgi:hypothetical protein
MSESSDFSAIRIGTRIRHSDGTAGRITWANATSVKIEWDDGEKVTWKRAELASKGLTITDEDQDTESQATEAAPDKTVSTEPTEPTATTESAESTAQAESQANSPIEPATTAELHLLRGDGSSVTVTYATKDNAATNQPTDAPAAKKRARRTQAAESKPGRLSAIDAAAKVLAEEGKPMGCQELIGAMSMKGYWTSPGGKTPAATLYSALLREIDTKGDAARFVKTGRGTFALRPQA